MDEQLNHVNNILGFRTILKKSSLIVFGLILFVSNLIAQSSSTSRTASFNVAWSFTRDSVASAEKPDFDDSKWRTITLPHDWSIEDLPNQTPDKIVGPFSKNSIGKAATGWTVGGTGWYRKKFVTEENWQNKLVSIHFDGVYMNSDLWLNGYHVGYHPYGYTPFYYDLTPYLKPFGQENIIAVRVRNEGKNSRWYAGSGIYRSVSLTITEPVHVATWGVYVTTPEVTQDNATVKIASTINNEHQSNSYISLVTTILDPFGKAVVNAQKNLQLTKDKSIIDEQTINLFKPALWSIETPQLYKAITEIKNGEKTIDRVETIFGVRSIHFYDKGFTLNGKTLQLKGGCIHHDNGPLGAMAFERAEERKIEILKKNGYNAIRSSHNPPSQALLDACDRLGMLVMDEAFDTWIRPKNPQDYNLYFNEWGQKDMQAMILRDRNHPSVIMWSIGNEIYEVSDALGQEIGKRLADEVRRLDSTRPVSAAIVYLPPFTKKPWEDYETHLADLDVDGYNYFLDDKSIHYLRDSITAHRFDSEHAKHPKKAYVVTESLPIYALENWEKSERCPYVIGGFKWTAFDYIGEAGLGKSREKPITGRPELKGLIGMGMFFKDEWPIFASGSGDFDLIGGKKQASYYQDVVWRISPIEMLVHYPVPEGKKELIATWGFPEELKSWTWPGQEGKKLQVHVYTRSKVVKLELNGKIIAEQTVPDGSITATFEIDYQPGILIAKGYDEGKQTCSNTLKTVSRPAGIRLVADRSKINADPNDLSYVSVEIIDAKGNVVPNVDDLDVSYQLLGNATIVGAGNGNAADMSSFQQNHKKVYQGRGMVIIRSNGTPGKIILKARANGITDGSTEIVSE